MSSLRANSATGNCTVTAIFVPYVRGAVQHCHRHSKFATGSYFCCVMPMLFSFFNSSIEELELSLKTAAWNSEGGLYLWLSM
jgi:hypothetical protein